MYINLSCLSQLVGCITDAASTAFVSLPLIPPPPPPAILPLLDNRGRYQVQM